MRLILAVIVLTAAASIASAEDYATRMLEATFKIYHKDSTATGFFVNPPAAAAIPEKHVLLVTAAHVFERMKGEQAIIVLRKPHPDGTFTRRDFEVKVREGEKPLWFKHPEQDIAVLAVKLPEDANVQPIEFESLADEAALKAARVHIGSDMLMLGFPMRVEANSAGFPIARRVSIASHPLFPIQPHKTFMADFTTFAGDSGGPLFLPDPSQKDRGEEARPLVVGIVLSQHFSDEKLTMVYEERMIHHPLNLSTVIHAQFVREAIEKYKK